MADNSQWAPPDRSRARISVLGVAASLVLVGIGVAAAFRDFSVWPAPIVIGIVGVLIFAVAVPLAHRGGKL